MRVEQQLYIAVQIFITFHLNKDLLKFCILRLISLIIILKLKIFHNNKKQFCYLPYLSPIYIL